MRNKVKTHHHTDVNDYYPFGLGHVTGTAAQGADYQYLYNGKELQEELGLGWYDYGARFYQPETGRWNGVDALGEKYMAWSGWNYVLNNPVIFNDPTGLTPEYDWQAHDSGRPGVYKENGEEKTWDQVEDQVKEGAISLKPNTVYMSTEHNSGEPGSSIFPNSSELGRIQSQIKQIYKSNCIDLNVEGVTQDEFTTLRGMIAELKKLNVALLLLHSRTAGGQFGRTPINISNGDEAISHVYIGEFREFYDRHVSLSRGGRYWNEYLRFVAHVSAHELYHLYRYRAYKYAGMNQPDAVQLASNEPGGLGTDGRLAIRAYTPKHLDNTSSRQAALNLFYNNGVDSDYRMISDLFESKIK